MPASASRGTATSTSCPCARRPWPRPNVRRAVPLVGRPAMGSTSVVKIRNFISRSHRHPRERRNLSAPATPCHRGMRMLASPPAPPMKVLLFANDLMPFGPLPTSGGGLRCYQLMKGLEAHGVEVLASMPGFTFLAEKHFGQIPAEQRELLWRWETQDSILRDVKPDVVLFASNW